MRMTRPSPTPLAVLAAALLAFPLAGQQPEDFLGLRVRLAGCSPSEATVLFPARPGASIRGLVPDCSGGGRLQALWGQAGELPVPAEDVRVVFTASEGADRDHRGSLAVVTGTVGDRAGRVGNALLPDALLVPVPAPVVRGMAGSVLLVWDPMPVEGLAGYLVYRTAASGPAGATASEYLAGGPAGYVPQPAGGERIRFWDPEASPGFYTYALRPVLEGRPDGEPNEAAPDPGTFAASHGGVPLLSADSEIVYHGGGAPLDRPLVRPRRSR